MSADTLIQVENLQKYYKGGEIKALDGVNADIRRGKVDCVIIDDQVALSFVKGNEGLKTLDTAYAFEEYAVCFAKESPIYADFNAALEELIADGTVQTILDKYISE